MKTSLLARLALVLFPLTLWAAPPPRTIVVDVQRPLQTFSIRVAAGTTPLLRATVQNGGANYNTTGWTGVLFYARTKDSTQAVAIASTATGTNYVEFLVPAAKLASTGGAYFAQLVLAESGGPAVEWSRGQFTIDASPGTYGAALTNFSPTLNWDLIGTYLGTPPWALETNGLTQAQAGQIATNVTAGIGNASSNFTLARVSALSSNVLSKAGGMMTGTISFAKGYIQTGTEGLVLGTNVTIEGGDLNLDQRIYFASSPAIINFGPINAMSIYDDQSAELAFGLTTTGTVTAASLVGNGAGVTNVDAVSLRGISGTNYLRGVVFAGTTNRPNSSGLAVVGGVLSIAAYQADITNYVQVVVTNSPTVGVLNILKTMGDGTAWWGAP